MCYILIYVHVVVKLVGNPVSNVQISFISNDLCTRNNVIRCI